jgi:hypothetical protein
MREITNSLEVYNDLFALPENDFHKKYFDGRQDDTNPLWKEASCSISEIIALLKDHNKERSLFTSNPRSWCSMYFVENEQGFEIGYFHERGGSTASARFEHLEHALFYWLDHYLGCHGVIPADTILNSKNPRAEYAGIEPEERELLTLLDEIVPMLIREGSQELVTWAESSAKSFRFRYVDAAQSVMSPFGHWKRDKEQRVLPETQRLRLKIFHKACALNIKHGGHRDYYKELDAFMTELETYGMTEWKTRMRHEFDIATSGTGIGTAVINLLRILLNNEIRLTLGQQNTANDIIALVTEVIKDPGLQRTGG